MAPEVYESGFPLFQVGFIQLLFSTLKNKRQNYQTIIIKKAAIGVNAIQDP
ncbi:MAG: hypothetical protein JRE58_13870 [Deltaproteobacteria bacterium]|nr:hypothetical protein [Deltaproteobacteria bacterium]